MNKEWYKFEGFTEDDINDITKDMLCLNEINEYGWPVKYINEDGVVTAFALYITQEEFEELDRLRSSIEKDPNSKNIIRITKVKTK